MATAPTGTALASSPPNLAKTTQRRDPDHEVVPELKLGLIEDSPPAGPPFPNRSRSTP
jgi:hypothetical protein